jgi:hypothetical protein
MASSRANVNHIFAHFCPSAILAKDRNHQGLQDRLIMPAPPGRPCPLSPAARWAPAVARDRASGAGFLNDPNATVLASARLRLDDDLHVLPEPGQETHQTLAREVCESAA